MQILYLYRLPNGECYSHDGYIQIGIYSHSVETHMKLNPTIHWVETNWLPDIFTKRYSFEKDVKRTRI